MSEIRCLTGCGAGEINSFYTKKKKKNKSFYWIQTIRLAFLFILFKRLCIFRQEYFTTLLLFTGNFHFHRGNISHTSGGEL